MHTVLSVALVLAQMTLQQMYNQKPKPGQFFNYPKALRISAADYDGLPCFYNAVFAINGAALYRERDAKWFDYFNEHAVPINSQWLLMEAGKGNFSGYTVLKVDIYTENQGFTDYRGMCFLLVDQAFHRGHPQ